MTKIIFGNHSSVLVRRQDRDSIRGFYCDVLGGEITQPDPDRDFVRLGESFYIVFLYGDVTDESEFLRSARSVWLEIKSDNVAETRRQIPIPVSSENSRYRIPTFTSRPREVNVCAWSASTRTSPSMRGPDRAPTLRR